MNFTVILIFSIVILIGILWIYYALRQYNIRRKGRKGERKVRRQLNKLPSSKYRVLNNLLFATPHGFTEVDHVVVSRHGVFVIETKNYNGSIYGNGDNQNWKHYIGRREHDFLNPIKQNHGHIVAVRKILRNTFPEMEYISIITFPPTTKLKVEYDNENTLIIHWNKLRRKIRYYGRNKLTSSEVNHAAGLILKANVSTAENRRKHIKNLKRKY